MTPSYDRYLDALIDEYCNRGADDVAADYGPEYDAWLDERAAADRDAIDAAGEVAL